MNVGGTARYVGELVEKIPNSKLATGYVQGSEIEDPCGQKLEVLRVPHMGRKISPVNDFRAWLELRRIVKAVKPAIVHTHTFKAGLIGRLVAGSHKRVHTFHGHLFDDNSFTNFEKKVIIFTEKLLASRTDLLISVGKKVGVELRAHGIGADSNWLSIAPGVEALPAVAREQARNAFGFGSEGALVGWMARMTEVKNPFLLVEIATQLPEIVFLMAGGGNLLEDVRAKAPKNLVVIGWVDASAFWSAVDCAISTSDNEGMPIALIEAQLAGVPVIATDVGSNSEVIRDRITGIIVSKKVHDIVNAIQKMIEDEHSRKAMGIAAKQWGLQEFNLKKMLDAHKEAYLHFGNFRGK
jgi:glycosyltransferase involved in cell wall biosynthesis